MGGRSAEDEDPLAAASRGVELQGQGDQAGALAAYQEAIDSGHPGAAARGWLYRGVLLNTQGDAAGARAAYQVAIDSGDAYAAPRAAWNLGGIFMSQGDMAGARSCFQLVAGSGYEEMGPMAFLYLGWVLEQQGDTSGATAAYRAAAGSGHADAAPRASEILGQLLDAQDEWDQARVMFQIAFDSGHPEVSPRAAVRLGELLNGNMDSAPVKAALRTAMDTGDSDARPRAASVLGRILEAEGDMPGALAAFEVAKESSDPNLQTAPMGPSTWSDDFITSLRASVQSGSGTAAGATEGSDGAADPAAGAGLTNRDLVGRGLETLATGLGPFVNDRMTSAAPGGRDWAGVIAARDRAQYGGNRQYSLFDPRFLLRVLTQERAAFGDLPPAARGYAAELRDTGNRWAHGEAFSASDTHRALDTMERLLAAVGSAETAQQIRNVRASLR
jgi:tetratricopeptide (TPR) repeat protein